MSKNQQKSTFNDASGLLNSWESSSSQLSNDLNGTAADAGTTASNTWKNLLPTGGYNPSQLQDISNANTNLTSTGGFDPSRLAGLENTEAGNTQTGGFDPSQVNSLNSNYANLISTGGISPATQAAMQRQATSGVQSIYDTMGAQLARTRAATGGEGGVGSVAQLARQAAEQEANAVTGVNAQVGQLRQQGTEAGLSGASNLQNAIASGRNQAAGIYSGTQGNVAGGVQYGTNLENQLGSNVASGSLASAGGLSNIYNTAQSAALGQQGLQLQGNLGYLGAMSGIANAQKGPLQNTEDIFGLLGSGVNSAANLIYATNH